jgi:hypothetical protein
MKTTILVAALIGLAAPALANKLGFDYKQMNWDYERMSVMVASGDCFNNMPVFHFVDYTEYCGADYMQRTLEEVGLCQHIVDRYNDELRHYNDVRRKCMREGSKNE